MVSLGSLFARVCQGRLGHGCGWSLAKIAGFQTGLRGRRTDDWPDHLDDGSLQALIVSSATPSDMGQITIELATS
jgi:hypothetical protein